MLINETWQDSLLKAREHFKIADHMVYVSYSLLQDKRLMIKILSEIGKSVRWLMKGLLQYGYSLRQVPLYKDPRLNFKTFREKIAPRYMGKEDFEALSRVLEIEKKHKESAVEFVRKDKFVILIGDTYVVLEIELLKEFLVVVKKVLKNIKVDM